jgi:hypothetical protein
MEGPAYSTLKSEIFMIKYQNGTKDVFKTQQPIQSNVTPVSNEELKKNEAVKNLEAYVKNKIKGPVTSFEGFRKTNGVMNNLYGQFIYTINFDVDMKFVSDGWLKGNGLEGYWRNSFYVYPSEPDLYAAGEQYMYATKLFPSGTFITLGCIAEMESTDNGFLVKSLSIKTETNHGIVAGSTNISNNQQIKKPKSNAEQIYLDKKETKITTNYIGHFNNNFPKGEYKSLYEINYKYYQPPFWKNVFYKSNIISIYTAGFGKLKKYENAELIVKSGDSLLFRLITTGIPFHKKTGSYTKSLAKYTLSIQVEDSLGHEYFSESENREFIRIDDTEYNTTIRLKLGPDKLFIMPRSQVLYLNFLITDRNEKDRILQGFATFKIVE